MKTQDYGNEDTRLCKKTFQENVIKLSFNFNAYKYPAKVYYKIKCAPNDEVLNSIDIKEKLTCVPIKVSDSSDFAYGCKARKTG